MICSSVINETELEMVGYGIQELINYSGMTMVSIQQIEEHFEEVWW